MAKALRSLAYVEPSLPTLALVGAPNVGKSSLVRELSTGIPEVQNYPFTTRHVLLFQGERNEVVRVEGEVQGVDEGAEG